jgi:hypothetical protein
MVKEKFFSQNSMHAKLYKFTYGQYLPDGLCLYFWKLVIATIIFIPNFIMQFPSRTLAYVLGKFNKEDNTGDEMVGPSDYMVLGVISYIAIFISIIYFYGIVSLVKEMFNCYSYNHYAANLSLTLTLAVLAIIGLRYLVIYLANREEKITVKEPSVIKEFIKAKYGKYCPRINWKD